VILSQPKWEPVFQIRDLGGWKIRKDNSSILTEGGTKTNRPEKGRNKYPEIFIPKRPGE
jgi:hypothetical protein